jgi:TPR repeat protein
MQAFRYRRLLLIIALVFPKPSAQAGGSAQQECDALAASSFDLSRPAGVPGIQFENIDAPRAEAACRRAIQEQPLAGLRLRYQLARALHAGHKDTDAIASYRVAADQGYAAAQSNLGLMYQNGLGVAKDDAQAVSWYRKAADQGYAAAQSSLGLMYQNGLGVARDDAQAVSWYRKAADQGLAAAQSNLGQIPPPPD